jgi:HlyD family secretion protein
MSKLIQSFARKPLFLGGGATLAIILIIVFASTPKKDVHASSFYEAKRGDFLISVVEGGTLEAVNEVVVRSEVEGTARIIFIVPEGSYVKKGDLLVELDSASTQDAVNQQQINVEKAQFALIQAEQQLEIQKSTVDSEVDAAKLKVIFAEIDLDKYLKGEELQLLRNAEIDIININETLKINEERLTWTKRLYTNGFETKATLDKDSLSVSQAQLKLEQAEKTLDMLQKFDGPKKKKQLQAAVNEAKEELDRVELQGKRKIAQSEADVSTQKKTLELSVAKLDRDKKQLLATKIYAPQDGLVVYASAGGGRFSNESLVEEGAVVRNRQELIKLPDIAEMKLMVKIHESHINQIRLGQPAFVVLDSMPDKRFRGVVTKVAPLPDSSSRWSNPNLKVYATEVRLAEHLPDVKPGVSARAEVVITNLNNVLTVPIQAVATRKGQQVVYLAGNPSKPVPVSVGMYNNKFIEIANGINPGDRVLLSPPFESQDKDLGGAIIAQGDALPASDSNLVASAKSSPGNSTERFGPRGNSDLRPGAQVSARGFEGAREERGGPGSGFEERRRPGDGTQLGAEGQPAGERRQRANREGGAPNFNREGGAPAFGEGAGNREGRAPGAGREGGGAGGFNREAMMKEFDKNGDGTLDDEERAAMRERFGNRRRNNSQGDGTNAVPSRIEPSQRRDAPATSTAEAP